MCKRFVQLNNKEKYKACNLHVHVAYVSLFSLILKIPRWCHVKTGPSLWDLKAPLAKFFSLIETATLIAVIY